jgi:hypothetical protein
MLNDSQMNTDSSLYFDDKDRQSLEKNHTHFLLLDDGKYHSHYLYNETNESITTLINPLSKLNRHDQQNQNGLLNVI